MERAKLEMDFLDEMGKKFTLSIDDPRLDLTDMEVKAVMEGIVNSNVFFTANGDIVEPDSARIITTIIDELEI
ncbi:DUF2922 domain-containing protein [Tepidimicrobium xylanilyticum]|uniref:DUF2922 domain-containing protein n=1 Tax=Tepidimicrobium xylanilyticum TaxID=1123352 RepID=A0A1H2QVN9_9FIRM|nr:DUF2922 domain-containing protein [Tepidimicrobium xylanilyticum]GMG95570.1 hypothetical protein EN5CB1_03960 [Tepidimicrobium xylanilyticum]SDW11236.1 Protein of unknown function [Tepidimicrobium xylanilyticum]